MASRSCLSISLGWHLRNLGVTQLLKDVGLLGWGTHGFGTSGFSISGFEGSRCWSSGFGLMASWTWGIRSLGFGTCRFLDLWSLGFWI